MYKYLKLIVRYLTQLTSCQKNETKNQSIIVKSKQINYCNMRKSKNIFIQQCLLFYDKIKITCNIGTWGYFYYLYFIMHITIIVYRFMLNIYIYIIYYIFPPTRIWFIFEKNNYYYYFHLTNKLL